MVEKITERHRWCGRWSDCLGSLLFCHLLAVWWKAGYSHPLGLTLPICEMGIIRASGCGGLSGEMWQGM